MAELSEPKRIRERALDMALFFRGKIIMTEKDTADQVVEDAKKFEAFINGEK